MCSDCNFYLIAKIITYLVFLYSVQLGPSYNILLQLDYLLTFPEFKEDDFTRVWKGLFYAVWMSDKPLVQVGGGFNSLFRLVIIF